MNHVSLLNPIHTHMMFSASIAFRDVFKAACCKYGVSDITLLAKETHKFESRYPGKGIYCTFLFYAS